MRGTGQLIGLSSVGVTTDKASNEVYSSERTEESEEGHSGQPRDTPAVTVQNQSRDKVQNQGQLDNLSSSLHNTQQLPVVFVKRMLISVYVELIDLEQVYWLQWIKTTISGSRCTILELQLKVAL